MSMVNSKTMDSKTKNETMVADNNIELNWIRNKLTSIQATVISDVEKRMTTLIEEVLQEIRQHELQATEFKDFAKKTHQHTHKNHTWSNRIMNHKSDVTGSETDVSQNEPVVKGSGTKSVNDSKRKKVRSLPDKIFVTRESYLTALLEVDHMKSIYHIFNTIMLLFLLNCMCHDYFVEGRINFGLGTFKTGLTRVHYVFGIWVLEHVFVFLLYYAFKGWATIRAKLRTQVALSSFFTECCLITYISSQLLFGYTAFRLCLKLDLPFVSASILLLESTRLLMKMHAFIRSNAGKIMEGKLKVESDPNQTSSLREVRVPPFKSYLYFLFAPTLIYRDSYPRTSQIRWKFAISRFMEIVAIAFLYSFIHERQIRVNYANYGLEELNPSLLIVKFFGMLMPCVIIFLTGFYLILHAWLNFTAELLRFGDRMFYKDWWTAWTYDSYYRNWNVVVHDWLYEYIYKDCYNYVFKNSKLGASLMVFFVSALVHELILGFALQIFFPVIFVLFGFVGVALVFLTRKAPKIFGNVLLWFSLILGNGVLISLYCMEFYACHNCPKTYQSWSDYLIPAVWSCYRS